ncbi:MAG TPA: VWA domain-containing protein [Candidatus Binataceae bacterium]|nr:VWA domain-containing protein [Candidatus Binataceae bacterium]
MFERPELLWLMLLAPVAVLPGLAAIRRGKWLVGGAAAALRFICLMVLVLLLAGLRIATRTGARGLAVIVVRDQSNSIAPDQAAWMDRRVSELGRTMDPRDRLAVLGFGRDARLLAPLSDPRLVGRPDASAEPNGTDIAGALAVAAGLFPDQVEKRLLLLSDGIETLGNAVEELPVLAEQDVRVFTDAPPPSSTQRIALTTFEAPSTVRAHSSFAFHVDIESEAPAGAKARLKLESDGASLGSRDLKLHPGLNRFELPYRIDQPGAYIAGAELEADSPIITLNRRAETAISVIGPPRVLVVSNEPPQSVMDALKVRNYRVDQRTPQSLSANSQDLLAYQAVILADVPQTSLPDPVQQALRTYVSDFGGGLIVTGEALADDRFEHGALESVLPIKFQPQPRPPSREPVAIYLCIDRSNSMSYNSRYPAVRDGERIRYAKQAAVALLRQLDDTDFVGVIAFDSQPYVLSRLHPLGEDRAALEDRVERLEPGGGTDFKEALEIAEHDILASRIAVRQVILLTDGDTNRQYHDHDALIADFAREHIPVSTVRIGPDLANLRLLEDFAEATGGVFYRVDDIEKLPQLFVRLTRQVASRTSQNRIHLKAEGHSAILSGIKPDEIPQLEFYTTTEAKDGASVPIRIERGKERLPLVAAWQYGLGRTAVFAADPDSMATLTWVHWNRYAEFWSQLITWTMRRGDAGPFDLRIASESGGAIRFTAEKAEATGADNLMCRVAGGGRSFDVALSAISESLFEGQSASLPRGKYSVALIQKTGADERVILTRQFAVAGPLTADAAELRIRPANTELLKRIAAETDGGFAQPMAKILQHTGATVTVRSGTEPYLLPLAILLILAEAFVRRRLLPD